MRPATNRERTLLLLCFAVIFIVVNVVVGRTVMSGFGVSRTKLAAAENERQQQLVWLKQRDAWMPRYIWLDQNMPTMESSSKAGAQLLEEMQDQAHDLNLRLRRQNLLEAQTTQFYHEVSVHLEIEGDLAKMTDWLTTLQQPEAFTVIKRLEVSLDTKSRAKEPQGRCTLVIARWYSLHAHTHGETASEPEEMTDSAAADPNTETTAPSETETNSETETDPTAAEPELEPQPAPEPSDADTSDDADSNSETETETEPKPEPQPEPSSNE